MHTPVRVLFVCDGGSARSRMAEALLRQQGGDRFEVHSAGIEAETLHPLAIEAMDEIGIQLDNTPTHALNDLEETQFDYVISLCDEARTACLSFPRDTYNLHWIVADPSLEQGTRAEQLAAYQQVRDGFRKQVRDWLEALGKTA